MGSLEWKMRKAGEALDTLRFALRDNREYGMRKLGYSKPAMGRRSNWPWQN